MFSLHGKEAGIILSVFCNSIIDLYGRIVHNRQMNRCCILVIIFAFIIILFSCPLSRGQDVYPQERFFSTERFLLAADLLSSLRGSPESRKDLKLFAKYFTKGAYDLSDGNYRQALKSLQNARRMWPEYFGTDFLIALALEESGDIRKAARFYKGYLDKLKTLELGHFPISGPLIRSLSVDSVDNYTESNMRIMYHLKKNGIDLARVKLPVFMPDFVKITILFFLLVTVAVIARYTIVPYLEMRNRIKHVAAGYRICRKCGEINPDLSKECGQCGSKY